MADQQPADFLAFLAQRDRGRTADALGKYLTELVKAVHETEKPGSITLTIKISPDKKKPEMVLVEDDIKRKVPEADRRPGVFFTTPDGQLTTTHPDQHAMFDVREEKI